MEYNNNEYIYQSRDKYVIKKTIHGKLTYYGTFLNLNEAKKYRDFLVEHDWDPKYKKIRDKNMRYIYKVNQKWMIQNRLNEKHIYFGVYSTLEEAQKRRDFLEEHDWDTKYREITNHTTSEQYHLPRNVYYRKCDGKYEVKKVIDGEIVYAGTYHSLEEAVHERDFYQSINWNMDLIDLY